ncbi:MAG TPA: pitrilysin family protein [Candidatus Limnocylindrales bacterium]|nr:pitrilysin family protein [Candidatus Limnocylindrales bacterium]
MTRRNWLAMAAASAFAAEPKKRVPISRETLVVRMPDAEPVRLANGATILAIEDRRLPIALISFKVEGAGEIFAPQPGEAAFTASMLTEGAAGRSGKQIALAASRAGTVLSAYADLGDEVAVVDGDGLAAGWPQWFELMCGVVRTPAFPSDEFQQMRQRWEAGLRLQRPVDLADQRLLHMIYGKHPAGNSLYSAEALASFTPEILAAWHRERYTPSNTVILCIGKVRPSELRAKAEKLLGDWHGSNVAPSLPPAPEAPASRKIALIDRPGAPQTLIQIGALAIDRRSPDYFPLLLLNQVLGTGMSSRFIRILRREKRYAFFTGSVFTAGRFAGFWRARATVRADATMDSLEIMLDQLRQMCDGVLPSEELEQAKRAATGEFALGLEEPSQVLGHCYQRFRYGFSTDYWDRYPAKIEAVSAREIQAAAQKYFDPNRLQIVLSGDLSRWRSALEKLGPVQS